MKAKLGAFAGEQRSSASEKILGHLLASAWWAEARRVASFSARSDEPDTSGLFKLLWESGRSVLLPRICGNALEFYAVKDKKGLLPGAFGLLEPDPSGCPQVPPSDIDLILVPGLAFDRNGHRLGRGKGFYDRFLTRPDFRAPCVGLFFAMQEVEIIPAEEHDRRLDGILTEQGLIPQNSKEQI